MENTETIRKGKEFSPYKLDDKHYYGSFFNLANNNINDLFSEFKSRLNIKNKETNAKIIVRDYFTDSCSIVDWERGIRILSEYLPVVRFLNLSIEAEKFNKIETKRRAYFRDNFIYILKAVEELRNFYTHYYHDEINFKDYSNELFIFLDNALLKTALNVKINYLKTDKTKEILKDTLKNQIEELIKIKLIKLKQKKEENRLKREAQKQAGETQDREFKYSSDREQIISSIYNDAFSKLLAKNGNYKETILKDFSKTSINEYNNIKEKDFELPISTSGIVFLLSMFLSAREIEDFKSNIKGFKGKIIKEDLEKNNSLLFMATHKVYSILSFKGLKHRVKTSEFDKETLLMQMIDELSKVPHSVYKVLSDDDQKEFIEDINEYFKDNDENKENFENSLVVNPVVRKRYEDKFNYFVIRYLDEYADFPTLKFQVHLGNYVHDNRQKKVGTTIITSERIIKEKINVFGNLSKVGNLKTDFFDKIEDEETNWEFFPNPSYNFLDNNIPIFLKLKDTKGNLVYQEKERIKELIHKEENRSKRKNSKPSKSDLINEIIDGNECFIQGDPTAILSLNELPALLYELLVNKKTGAEIENSIRDKIIEQFNSIKSVDATKTLSKDYFPKNLSKAKNSPTIDYDKLKRDIQIEIENTKQKIKILTNNKEEVYQHNKAKDSEKSKYRKYVFFTSEKGVEATWLANDIKRFMPQKVKEDWKGYQHSELQRALAFYDYNKAEVLCLLSVWNFNSDDIGKELAKCFTKTTFEDFYESYLLQRLSTLQIKLKQIENEGDDPKVLKIISKECFRYFKQQNYIIQPLATQVNRLLAQPTNLPRGIFDSKPTRIKDMQFNENKNLFADWFVFANDASHEFQSFYNNTIYNRNYSNLYNDNLIYNLAKELTPAKQFSNFEKRQEGEIRKQKINDVFTKLMVDDLFYKTFKEKITFSLQELFQTKDQRLKNQILADQQKNRQKGDKSENIKNLNFIWNKEVAIQLHEGSNVVEKVKLKDVGKFRKYEKDERIKTLLQYEPNLQWKVYLDSNWKAHFETKPLAVFQIQIEEYEQIRSESLFKLIHAFEKDIYEQVSDKSVLLEKGVPNFKRYIINGYLQNIKGIAESELSLFDLDLGTFEIPSIESFSTTIQMAYLLIMIRNKFAHNQLPSKAVYDLANKYLVKQNNQTYANYFLQLTEQLIVGLKKEV